MFGLLKERSKIYRIYIKREDRAGDIADLRLVPEGADLSPLFFQLFWPVFKGMPIVALAGFACVFGATIVAGKALIATGGDAGLGFLFAIYGCVVAAYCAFAEEMTGLSLRLRGYVYSGITHGTSEARAFERALETLSRPPRAISPNACGQDTNKTDDSAKIKLDLA